jgi:hypothetical protein
MGQTGGDMISALYWQRFTARHTGCQQNRLKKDLHDQD